MFTRKQHIVRKTLIIASSFVMGATLTLFAASAYDASVQSRATKIFESIKSNAATMNDVDSAAYYTLVRMNIKTLIEVLSLVETNLSGEINTGASSSLTGAIQPTNTGTQVIQTINPPVGWSRVDGPKSIYPKTTEDLKFICKEGYRLPTNAEWEKLRQPGAGDLFTKEAQKLGLSSAYYWTQEGDIFYVMNGESGYLNPVKGDDRERIRNIAHYTRCISVNGAGISVGGSTITTPVNSAPTNTGVVSTGTGISPKANTGVVSTPIVVSENIAGWSRVDGPKSIYPKTTEDLKFICKEGYRLPTNAEWEKLRQPGAGDLFTKEAQKLGLSSAYYWTQEGDIFYVMNGESGYLNPVKGDDRERIRNIAHYTRCISEKGAGENITASGGVGQSSQVIGSSLNLSLKDPQSLVGKTLSESKLVDAIVEKYISSNYYFEIKKEAKEIEQKTVSYRVTKVVDHGSNPPVKESAPSRLLTWWYGFGPTQSSMNDSLERYLRDLNAFLASSYDPKNPDGQKALDLYGSRENAKQYMFIVANGICPEGSEMYATSQYLNGTSTTKERQNICKVKGEEKYFTLYFNSFPEPEKVTQKYSGTLSSREYDMTKNPVCELTKEFSVFGKKVIGEFQKAEITFNAEMNIGKTKQERVEKPWTSSSFSFITIHPNRQGECFATPNGGIYQENDVGFRAMSPYEIEYGICPGLVAMKGYGQGSFSPAYRLGSLKEVSCSYSYRYNP